jgi:hypothetical protein
MAYISAEEVREIRKELKKEFPKYKFSVRKRQHSVSVNILKSDLDFRSEFRDPTEKYEGVNQYFIDKHWSKKPAKVLNKILEIIKTAPANAENGEAWFDESDIMTDYFHTAFYIDLQIGTWEKPYELI